MSVSLDELEYVGRVLSGGGAVFFEDPPKLNISPKLKCSIVGF